MVSSAAKDVLHYVEDIDQLRDDTFGRFLKTNNLKSTPLKVCFIRLCNIVMF